MHRLSKQLEEIHIEAKMIEAAYIAVAQASGQTMTPYPAKLAALVARLAKMVQDEDERSVGK